LFSKPHKGNDRYVLFQRQDRRPSGSPCLSPEKDRFKKLRTVKIAKQEYYAVFLQMRLKRFRNLAHRTPTVEITDRKDECLRFGQLRLSSMDTSSTSTSNNRKNYPSVD
jgi:hypothetical protein